MPSDLSQAGASAHYVVFQVKADAPGLVRIRGDGVQGIDWPASGAGAAALPLLVYGPPAEGLTISVNGRPQPFVSPTTQPWPTGERFDDDAYQQASLWKPAVSPQTRQWTLGAVAIVVLVFGVAAYADPKRATLWIVVAAGGLCVGIAAFFPTDSPRRELDVAGQERWEWVWHAGRPGGVVEEPWSHGLRFVPQSAEQLKQADPVLRCDMAGQPISVVARLNDSGRAVFIRRRVTSSEAE